jgi:anthranilate phosphoribosyltransferase
MTHAQKHNAEQMPLAPLQAEQLKSLIGLQLPEAEALALLKRCTPEAVTLDLLEVALACMQESIMPVAIPDVPVLDCCGTGGSGLSHFNTSTTVALVLAAGGVPVVKFGNRGFSSASGSFDLLAQLGIGHQLNPQRLPEVLAACGVAFLFAPSCYPALAGFAQLRKQLKTRTLFNFLGPLLNPVKPAYRLLGVSHLGMQQIMAQHLANSKHCQHAWLAHGADGLDEIAAHGPTQLLTVQHRQVRASQLIPPGDFCALPTGSHAPEENLAILQRLLCGADETSSYYRLVCLNAAAGFVIAGRATTLEGGQKEAQALLRSGQVLNTLQKCRSAHETFAQPSHAG